MGFDDGKEIGRLIAAYMDGSLDAISRERLERWRRTSAKNEEIFHRMTSFDYVNESIERYVEVGGKKEAQWKKIADRTVRRKRIALRKTLRYASVAVVAVAAIMWVSKFVADRNASQFSHTKIARYSDKPVLILPDGTHMELTARETTLEHNIGRTFISYSLNTMVVEGESRMPDEEEHPEAMLYHTLKVPRGEVHILKLPDSTLIHLNSDSEIMFPAKFARNERKVFLRKGEAYFQVARDEERPFIAEMGPVSVEVLGTSFSIRAYDDEENINTVLETGSVRVQVSGETVTLLPGTQGLFDRRKGTLEVGPADLKNTTSWMNGRLAFDNTPLKEILRDLSRTYNFIAEFESSEIGNIPFSLNIKKDGAFDEVLELIEATGKVRFDIDKSHKVLVKSAAAE